MWSDGLGATGVSHDALMFDWLRKQKRIKIPATKFSLLLVRAIMFSSDLAIHGSNADVMHFSHTSMIAAIYQVASSLGYKKSRHSLVAINELVIGTQE